MSDRKETLSDAILRTLTGAGSRASYDFANHPEGPIAAGTLAGRIYGAAVKLRHQGLERGQIVPLLCPTSPALWTGFVGAMAADLLPCNLPLPTFKTHLPTYLRNLEALMDRYGTDVVIASKEVSQRLRPAMTRTVRWIDASEIQGEAEPGATRSSFGGVAFLQHSSGSTGVPKGVALTHEAVLDHLVAYGDALGVSPGRDSVATWLPLYHDMGLITSFLLPLRLGISCRSMTPEAFILDPLGFLEDAASEKASLTWWPNFAFALLAERREAKGICPPRLDLSHLRAIVNCSEVVMTSSIDRFASAFAPHGLRPEAILASYAMAENVFAVTQTRNAGPVRAEVDAARLEAGANPLSPAPPPGRLRTLASSGRAIEGVDLRIVDADRRDASDGVVGEIAIRGPYLFAEYLGLEEETAERRQDGWYFTQDLGFLVAGELYVLGRETDLIVVGGRKFLPNEVERIAGSVRGVKAGRAVAFGVRSEARGTESAIAVVESPEAADPIRARAIRREIIQSVLQQMDLALSDVLVVPSGSLIKTSSGKIARKDNRSAYLESRVERKATGRPE